MLLSAVLLDLGVDVLHQRVPLHQHVGEGGAGENPHNLKRKQFTNYCWLEIRLITFYFVKQSQGTLSVISLP